MMFWVLTPGGGASTRCSASMQKQASLSLPVLESRLCAGSERTRVGQIKGMALRLLDGHFTDDIASRLPGFGCCRQLAGSSEITRG
jgi:hypothetical protein